MPRSLRQLSAVLLLAAAGCSTTGGTAPIDGSTASSDARTEIRERAEAEPRDRRSDRDVETPPGLDPTVFAANDSPATTLDAVLEALGPVELPPPLEPTGERDPAKALRHYIQGRDALVRGLDLMGITELEQAVKLDPEAPSIIRALAEAYLQYGQTVRAAERFRQLLAIDPDDARTRLFLGLEAANRRDFTLAVQHLGHLVQLDDPELEDIGAMPLARFWLWRGLQELGHDRAALPLGEAVVSMSFEPLLASRFGPQLASIDRGRSGIWQSIGDARCRLEDFTGAHEAYERAATLPTVEPLPLVARLMYLDLLLDRPFSAQDRLLSALAVASGTAGDAYVQLSAWLAAHVDDLDLLRETTLAAHRAAPDRVDLARIAAALQPADAAVELLSDLAARHRDDDALLRQLLTWLVEQDLSAALAFVVELSTDGIVADRAVRSLTATMSDAARAVEAIETLPQTSQRAAVETRLLVHIGALGHAWQTIEGGLDRDPDHEDLRLLAIRLAAGLEEQGLVDRAVANAADIHTVEASVIRSQAYIALGRIEDAFDAALAATEIDPDDPTGHLELARCELAFALAAQDEATRTARAQAAAAAAERAVELDPRSEDGLELLVELYGAGGFLMDADAFRLAARRLSTASPDNRRYSLLLAQEAMQQGQFATARERALPLYESDPADSAALAVVLSSWIRDGRVADSEAWLEERLVKRPGDPELMRYWVQLQLQQDRAVNAIDTLERRVRAQPRDEAARQMLETAYRQAGRLEDALPLGEARLSMRPAGMRRELEFAALYGGVNRTDEARERLQWVLDNADEATIEQLGAAINLMRRLIQDDPEAATLLLEFSERAVELHADAPLQIHAAGLIAIASMGELDARFDELADRAAAATRPGPPGILDWRDLAQALVDAGHPNAASRALRARFRHGNLGSETARAVLSIITLAADAGADRADATIEFLHELAAAGPLPDMFGAGAAPTLVEAMIEASTMYSMCDASGADAILAEAIRLEPDNSLALNNLGFARIVAGDGSTMTAEMIETAHSLDPESSFILDTLGWLRYLQGHYETVDDQPGAIELIARAASMTDDPSGEVLDHLGDANWRAGNADAAIAAWRRAESTLSDPRHRDGYTQGYLRLQTQQWGLLVSDPVQMYDRDFGSRLADVRAKIEAVEGGADPHVAPTFSEQLQTSEE